MKFSKTHLLVACAASTLISTGAQAQVALPAVELRGGGASSVADILPRTLNCIGNPGAGLNQQGTNSGALTTIAPGLYNPATPTAANPVYDCNTQEIQPAFEGKYISTGSGTGRTMWRTFSTANLNGTANNVNPFAGGAGQPSGWTNLQFAFSDSPISTGDLSTYNSTANSATNKAGAAIQIPFFVLPVAFVYNPVYGVKTTGAGTVDLKFNVKVKGTINGVVAGGLRLRRDDYCKIFNGEITNWNDAALKVRNGNTALFDIANDTLARWTSEGAPIRLVGRADGSGTTDIFTRSLAAQCNGLVAVNKFAKNAQALPFDSTSTIDIRRLQGSSPYFPAAAASGLAGTVQSLSGFVYDRNSHQICKWDELNTTTKQCDAAVKGSLTTQTGFNGDGLFMVADTAGGVNEAVLTTGNNTGIASAITPAITLNGKFGYNGADWVVPIGGRSAFSAALQVGNLLTGTSYVMPSAANASAAFGTTVLPPETSAASGAWAPQLDTRTLGAVDPSVAISAAPNNGASVPTSRANPLHWTAVVYNPNVAITSTLASPAKGYPVSGVTMLLTYTCFKPANSAVPGNNAARFAVAEYMGLMMGKVTKTSANTAISANTFKGTGATALGVIPASNVAQPPAGWQTAFTETFLKNSTQAGTLGGVATKLGAQNIWIQDNFPTTALDVDGVQQATDQKSNPTCDATKGA